MVLPQQQHLAVLSHSNHRTADAKGDDVTHVAKRVGRIGGPLVAVLSTMAMMTGVAHAGYLNGCTVPGANLYAAAGLAQGFGSVYCASNVSSMEVEVDLYELWTSDGNWHLMNSTTAGPTSPGNGRTLNAPPATASCKDSSQRDWKVIVTGYGDIGGTWFTDQKQLPGTLDCRA